MFVITNGSDKNEPPNYEKIKGDDDDYEKTFLLNEKTEREREKESEWMKVKRKKRTRERERGRKREK